MNDFLPFAAAGLTCIVLNIFPHAQVATPAERQAWEQVQKRGRGKFVLRCVFRQGLWVGAAFFGGGFLIASLLSFSLAWITSQFVELTELSLFLMLAAGAHYGSRTWRECERDYQNLAGNHVA